MGMGVVAAVASHRHCPARRKPYITLLFIAHQGHIKQVNHACWKHHTSDLTNSCQSSHLEIFIFEKQYIKRTLYKFRFGQVFLVF